VKFGDDLTQAEEWLQNRARKEGWEKISKNANVATSQGLLGMIVSNGFAAIVEVNCQTDFVSRNNKFRSFVAQISRGVFNDAARNYRLQNEEISSKWNLSYERLAEKELDFGSTMPDLLADNVGHLGEKITVGGAYIMRVTPDVSLAGYVHPRSDENIVDGVPMGHFATLVAYRAGPGCSQDFRAQLGMQLCQHIIGMNPTSIGLPPDSNAVKVEKVPEQHHLAQESILDQQKSTELKQKQDNDEIDEEEEREAAMNAQLVTKLSNETTLLRQDFMLEPDITVYEFLRQNDVTVVDFVRLERGGIGAALLKNV